MLAMMSMARSRLAPVSLSRYMCTAPAAAVETARAPTPSSPMTFNSDDSRLSADRGKMLAQFWRLREYSLDPTRCETQASFDSQFNALSKAYGYCPVDFQLKLEYYCRKKNYDSILGALRTMRMQKIACDRATYNLILESLSTSPKHESHCRTVLAQMMGSGIGPDQDAIGHVLSAHVMNKSVSQAITLLGVSYQRNFFPSSTLINGALKIIAEAHLLEEVSWLLECTICSPYPHVDKDVARLIVAELGATGPSTMIVTHMGNLKISPDEDLIEDLLRAFEDNAEMKLLIEEIKSSGVAPVVNIESTQRAPPLPKDVSDRHAVKASGGRRRSNGGNRRNR